MLIALVGVILLRVLPLDSPGDLRIPLVLLGVGLGLANPAAQAASLAGIPRADSGMAAGVSSTMRYLGGVIGIALLGRIGDHDLLVTLFAGVLVVAVGWAALLGRRPEQRV